MKFKKKCMVLGSSSFAGASFIDRALSAGFSVIGISRSPEPTKLFCPYFANPNKSFLKSYVLDLNKHVRQITNVFFSEKPEFIIDFAGQGMVAPSWDFPDQWYLTNTSSKAKFINSIKDQTFLEKYIKISTPEVYGSSSWVIREGHQMNPSSPYAISHAAIDMHLAIYRKEFNFPVVTGRFANFYGSNQQLYRVIPKAFLSASLGEIFKLDGGGRSKRAFIHKHDFCDGIFAMMEMGELGEIYHFSTNELITIKNLVKKIATISEVPFEKFVESVKDRRGKDEAYKMSIQFTKKQLNWSPKITLDEGLHETNLWIESNKDTFTAQEKIYNHTK